MNEWDLPVKTRNEGLSAELYHFQPEHRPPQGAVAQQAEPPGVGGHVAPDVTAALGPQVQGHDEVLLLQVPRETLQHTACLAGQDTWREGGNDADRQTDRQTEK